MSSRASLTKLLNSLNEFELIKGEILFDEGGKMTEIHAHYNRPFKSRINGFTIYWSYRNINRKTGKINNTHPSDADFIEISLKGTDKEVIDFLNEINKPLTLPLMINRKNLFNYIYENKNVMINFIEETNRKKEEEKITQQNFYNDTFHPY